MSDRLGPPDPLGACRALGLTPGQPHPKGATFSGGPIEHLAQGWARMCFKGIAGHWWREVRTDVAVIQDGGRVRFYVSSCGQEGVTTYRAPALGVGTMPVCKKCLKKHRHPTAAERWTFVDC